MRGWPARRRARPRQHGAHSLGSGEVSPERPVCPSRASLGTRAVATDSGVSDGLSCGARLGGCGTGGGGDAAACSSPSADDVSFARALFAVPGGSGRTF
jgi:hypothetical protein